MKRNKAAEVLLTTCSHCKKEEKILIVTDPTGYDTAKILWEEMEDYPKRTIAMMSERTMHGQEPSELVAAAMLDADVIFGCTKFSLFHSSARKNAVAKGARFVNMADYSVEMMYGGGLYADFAEAGNVCRRIASVLEGANKLMITCENGSHFECTIAGRKPFPQFGVSVDKGMSSSPPDVECATCAVEGTARGEMVIDGSIPHPALGLIREPIMLTIESGRIVKIKGGEQAKTFAHLMESFHDERVYQIGEIGIGLNPMCELKGRMLEDEGCGGTAHFGCGDNTGFGGIVACPIHIDLIFKNPTIRVDNTIVLDRGKVAL